MRLLPSFRHRALAALILASLSLSAFAASTLQMRVPIGDGGTPPAYAAAASIPGLNYAGGWYKAPQSAFSYGNGSYLTTSGNLQAQMTLATTSGAAALSGMQANPAGVAGTLAEAWLASKGVTDVGGQWVKQVPVITPAIQSVIDQCIASYYNNQPYCNLNVFNFGGTIFWIVQHTNANNTYAYSNYQSVTPGQTQSVPLTSSDWAALPDPTPAVGAELPYAPYMPQGAPLSKTTITNLNTGQTYTCTNGACG